MITKEVDIIVVGAGHAGIEAAYAAQKIGLKTVLITINLDKIGEMSCNPAIGGQAKGQLVKEIDALGGLMGMVADKAGIHFKILNKSKGLAVRAPRAQEDKSLYKKYMKNHLESLDNLEIYQGIVTKIETKNKKVTGVRLLDNSFIKADAVILTTGTFLNGLIHIGNTSYPSGRANEPASIQLAENIKDLGFKTIRLKTGTPMRLKKTTIDWDKFEQQPGDKNPRPFSWRTNNVKNQISCFIGRTNKKVHEIIEKNLKHAPLFSGRIKGIGIRYCPSIEDKIVKFKDKDSHIFFLEQEGLDTEEIYVNGISTSLPVEIQYKMLKQIPGLQDSEIMRPAYAIEYDSIKPNQIKRNMESYKYKNLFTAGQINGTSGYEEAAAQGLIAGINAALSLKNKQSFILTRQNAYIGVLIDDIVTRSIDEPYRLFSSRAEYRLLIRADNAKQRLMEYGFKIGLINEKDYKIQISKMKLASELLDKLKTKKFFYLDKKRTYDKSIKMGISFEKIEEDFSEITEKLSYDEKDFIKAEIIYEGYIDKLMNEIKKIKKEEHLKIPKQLKIEEIPSISTEIKEKIIKYKPGTIKELKEIPGITPPAISILILFSKKYYHENKDKENNQK